MNEFQAPKSPYQAKNSSFPRCFLSSKATNTLRGDYQYSRKEKYLKALLKRYQIAIFFALTFIISWYPWYTGGHGFKAAGPSYAGLIVVALVGGWKGIVEMLRRLIRWRASIGVWAVALLGPVVITLVAVGLHVLTGGDAPSFTFWKAKWYDPLLFMLLLISPFGGPGGEEPFGWRGYAQPKLQKKWGRWGPWLPVSS